MPFEKLGRQARAVLLTYLPGDRGELASLISVGRGGLSGNTLTAFRLSGVAHLIAVSGLHMGILSPGRAVPTQKDAGSGARGGALTWPGVRVYSARGIPRLCGAGGGAVPRGPARLLHQAAGGQPQLHRPRADPAARRRSLCRVRYWPAAVFRRLFGAFVAVPAATGMGPGAGCIPRRKPGNRTLRRCLFRCGSGGGTGRPMRSVSP